MYGRYRTITKCTYDFFGTVQCVVNFRFIMFCIDQMLSINTNKPQVRRVLWLLKAAEFTAHIQCKTPTDPQIDTPTLKPTRFSSFQILALLRLHVRCAVSDSRRHRCKPPARHYSLHCCHLLTHIARCFPSTLSNAHKHWNLSENQHLCEGSSGRRFCV